MRYNNATTRLTKFFFFIAENQAGITSNLKSVQSWIVLFRAFSSHEQPSAYLNQRYFPPISRPNWTNFNGLHSGIGGWGIVSVRYADGCCLQYYAICNRTIVYRFKSKIDGPIGSYRGLITVLENGLMQYLPFRF